MFSGMQSNQNQSNSYQPLGFVQSHYQGIPNQQTGRQSAGPVISHVGYSAHRSKVQTKVTLSKMLALADLLLALKISVRIKAMHSLKTLGHNKVP